MMPNLDGYQTCQKIRNNLNTFISPIDKKITNEVKPKVTPRI